MMPWGNTSKHVKPDHKPRFGWYQIEQRKVKVNTDSSVPVQSRSPVDSAVQAKKR